MEDPLLDHLRPGITYMTIRFLFASSQKYNHLKTDHGSNPVVGEKFSSIFIFDLGSHDYHLRINS